MPSVPPDRGRSGFRRLDEYEVVPGIQGLPWTAPGPDTEEVALIWLSTPA